MDHHFDIVVVGAGPAGCAAAIAACRAGRSVAVMDKATFPRDKCCGDGLTAAALRILEDLGLDPGKVQSWQPARRAVVEVPGMGALGLALPGDGLFAVSARRYHLDAALVDLARSNGAQIFEGHSAVSVSSWRGGSSVEVQSSSGMRITASYLIAADGMWSPVRKLLGSSEPGYLRDEPGYLGEWQAGREYLANAGPLSSDLWVFFEPDMLPGYAWSFPLSDGTVNVGYGILRHPAGDPTPDGVAPSGLPAVKQTGTHSSGLRGQRIDWSQRPQIARVLGPDAVQVGPWRSWPIPARLGEGPLSGLKGRVLFCGDAAGACDPMTGEGIAQALETATTAVSCVIRSGPNRPDLAAKRYKRRLRWGMQVDHSLSRAFSGVLAHQGGPARALSLVARSGFVSSNFARWMFEDYPRAIFATPQRWRPGILTRPGGYRDLERPRPTRSIC